MSGEWKRGVALIGRAGSGKTTIADALVRAGVCMERASFAAELKADLEKSDYNVLSIGTLKKTDDIDRLAKRIRERLRRF